jgi:hypothetical protein
MLYDVAESSLKPLILYTRIFHLNIKNVKAVYICSTQCEVPNTGGPDQPTFRVKIKINKNKAQFLTNT